ncbi:hypothetical protein [Lentzea sp. NPDC051838]|uniref:hypothetical protein n=1 Tax=Lentzea sp. NPDC051838 TaxID=3154849 RepID=UPI00341F6117
MSPELTDMVLRLNVALADHAVEPDQAVWLACDLLVAGVDTPALRELAGESPTRLATGDATALVKQVLVELGSTLMTEEEADWFIGREAARKILDGRPPSEWTDATWRINIRMSEDADDIYVAFALFDTNPEPYFRYVREYVRLADEQLTAW